jgi:hypothetical protein
MQNEYRTLLKKMKLINNLEETKCEKASRSPNHNRWNCTRRVQLLLRAHTVGWHALRISHMLTSAPKRMSFCLQLSSEQKQIGGRRERPTPNLSRFLLFLFLLAEKKGTVDPTWYTAASRRAHIPSLCLSRSGFRFNGGRALARACVRCQSSASFRLSVC